MRDDNVEQLLPEGICLRMLIDQSASFFGSAMRNSRGVKLNPNLLGMESSEGLSATFVLSR
jgi:hypothetical protein